MTRENMGKNSNGNTSSIEPYFSHISFYAYDIGLWLIPLVYLVCVGVGIISTIPIEVALAPASIVCLLIMGTLLFIFHPYRYGDP